MVHLLSTQHRSEFMAVPELVRFTVAQGQEGDEATLLIKASTLSLKYLLLAESLDITLVPIGESWLGYSLCIPDDLVAPGQLWSIAESDDELAALKMLSEGSTVVAFLFNELSVSVAWGNLSIDLSAPKTKALIETTAPAPLDGRAAKQMQDALNTGSSDFAGPSRPIRLSGIVSPTWHEIRATYITNSANQSPVSLFSSDEGGQQEEVGLWLIDNLHPEGAVKSPQVHEPSKVRELTDLLLTYEQGSVLIESKTLSVMGRDNLPMRGKLAQRLVKHLKKATGQLVGGVANLKRGCRVTDQNGSAVDVTWKVPPHVIILVPDLSLLANNREYGGGFFRDIMRQGSFYFHILDPSELLRMVQVAEMVASDSEQVTKMMAFDWYLMERAKIAANMPSAHFGMLFEKPGTVHVVSHVDARSPPLTAVPNARSGAPHAGGCGESS